MAAIVGEHAQSLKDYAAHLGKPGKGILSPGESTGTMAYRLAPPAGAISTHPQSLHPSFVLHDLIFGTPGAVECLSGVILPPHELACILLRLSKDDGASSWTAVDKRFVDVLKNNGVLPGVQVDKGIGKLDGTNGEAITHGLGDLEDRCQKYYRAGARFAKWCAVLKIGPSQPSKLAINENADRLARCASICQKNGLVPIVEPEILTDGDHDIHRCADVTERVLAACYKALIDNRVLLEGTVLKLNMVTPGRSHKRRVAPEVVAKHTLRALQRTVPAAVPTVLLFSGQSEEEAPRNLNAMNKREGKKPWSLSFSFGRRVSTSTLTRWGGKEMDEERVRAAFLARCKANSRATKGTYEEQVPILDPFEAIRIG